MDPRATVLFLCESNGLVGVARGSTALCSSANNVSLPNIPCYSGSNNEHLRMVLSIQWTQPHSQETNSLDFVYSEFNSSTSYFNYVSNFE